MDQALIFKCDDDDLCCACFADLLEQHEMPELLLAGSSTRTVPGETICPECGKPALRPATESAAQRIKDKWLNDTL